MKKPICPKCKSKRVVEIIYGMPDEKLWKKERRGEVILAGCIVDENGRGAFDFHCKACKHQWREEKC